MNFDIKENNDNERMPYIHDEEPKNKYDYMIFRRIDDYNCDKEFLKYVYKMNVNKHINKLILEHNNCPKFILKKAYKNNRLEYCNEILNNENCPVSIIKKEYKGLKNILYNQKIETIASNPNCPKKIRRNILINLLCLRDKIRLVHALSLPQQILITRKIREGLIQELDVGLFDKETENKIEKLINYLKKYITYENNK